MHTTSTTRSCTPTAKLRERLTGERPLDVRGRPCDPGDALPINPSLLAPTMLTQRELNYLYYLASRMEQSHEGRVGRIVELGCFLGGSTRPLVIGHHCHHPNPSPILVYDAFIAPDEEAFETDPSLRNYGLNPNQDFLDLYRTLHAPYLDKLTIRQGLIPGSFAARIADTLYPEQEPIALLFIDAAKAWGVHHTIAMTFYEHVQPGGVVVHQDIGDFRTPWLLIHMFQLREFFEPMDRVRGTPTISFRCTRTPTKAELSERLASTPSDFDTHTESPDWDALLDDWSALLGFDASNLWSGHRATHALHAGDPVNAIHHAELFDRWISTIGSAGHYTSLDWRHWIAKLPDYLHRLSASDGQLTRANTLARARRAYEQLDTPETVSDTWKTDAMKAAVWARVEDRLVREGVESVVLFGAGRHTRWLLGSGWPKSPISIECIIDEHPAVDSIAGIPVRTPEQLQQAAPINKTACVVLPSSDAYEAHLIQRARLNPVLSSLPIWEIYTDTQHDPIRHDQLATGVNAGLNRAVQYQALAIDKIDPTPPHRSSLGLPPGRAWIDQLASSMRWPSWARGHVNEQDIAFLWDIIELVSAEQPDPFPLIELGTASGVSTSALAQGLHLLAPTPSTVHAFDIMQRCYFDPAHEVGDAAKELADDLLDRITLHPGTNALDACRCFESGSVPLVFIDADHRHPAPALDLLALLPCFAPGAWVVLHDIELDLIQSLDANDPGSQSGPNRLFNAWAYDKIRPMHADLRESNIGAIKLPEHPLDARSCLLDLIDSAES